MADQTVPDDIRTDSGPDEDGDSNSVYVGVNISAGGINSSASRVVIDDRTDANVAANIIAVAEACAALHGSGVWMELQRQLDAFGSDD